MRDARCVLARAFLRSRISFRGNITMHIPGDVVAILWHTERCIIFSFFFFNERGKSCRTAWRAVESNAKHRFSIWQRAEKWKERLLFSSTPPHISSLHPPHTVLSFVPSSLSIDLNVTQLWHGFTCSRDFLHLPSSTSFGIHSAYDSTIASATLFSISISFFLAQPLCHCICIWWNTRCKIVSALLYGKRKWKVCGFVGIATFILQLFTLLIIRALSNLSIGYCPTNWLINAQLQTAANWSIETSLAVRCSICGPTPCACACMDVSYREISGIS